jgi:hypothetical protein
LARGTREPEVIQELRQKIPQLRVVGGLAFPFAPGRRLSEVELNLHEPLLVL